MTEQPRTHCLRYLTWEMGNDSDKIGDAITLARRLADSFDGVNTQAEAVYRCKQPDCALYVALGASALHSPDADQTREAGIAACEYYT